VNIVSAFAEIWGAAWTKGETTMRDKAARILVGVIVVSVLAIIGTGAGLIAVLRANGAGVNQPPVAQSTPALGVTHVFIRNFAYQPANIQVIWGTTVTWTNQDSAVHSVVLPHIITSETDIRESGPLSQGQSFNYTFLVRGTFQYSCIEHPYMIGIVTVT
jgi:plastocyanin